MTPPPLNRIRYYPDGSTKYIALLEFSFSVEEYLKGSGAEDIVAVWAGPLFDTQEEAEVALPAIAADGTPSGTTGRQSSFCGTPQPTSRARSRRNDSFFREILFGEIPDDYYSLASRHNRLWLPAAAAAETSQPAGEQQRPFLSGVPPRRVRLRRLPWGRLRPADCGVTAKLSAGGDGSEEYTECVRETYSTGQGTNSYLRRRYTQTG